MDHIADLITERIEARTDLGIRVTQLTTRGRSNIFFGSFVFVFALTRFLAAAIRGKVDLLHLNIAAGGSVYRKAILARVARLFKIPYVVHLHGGRFVDFCSSAGPHLLQAIDRLFSESEKVVVLGSFWAEFIVDRLAIAQSKIIILPNATKPILRGHEQPRENQIHIAYLGVLGPPKGTPQLIEALGQLAKYENWRATIAGNGDVVASRAYAQKLGIADRIDIPGWLNPPDVDKLLRLSNILVLPSFVENLPMTILEGFAHGLAVVSTPVGAIPEVIDNERNGLIVPAGEVGALVNALSRLIENPDLRRKLGAAARRDHAEHYDINVYVPRLAAIWREAYQGIKR